MSGRVASFTVFDTGWPLLKSSKWLPPTSRDTKTACFPVPRSSCHTTQGTVGFPGVSVPAATRGFSASLPAALLSVHSSSFAWLSAQLPKWLLLPYVSRTFVAPAVPFPAATQWKPPSADASATILAAKTMSLLRRPASPVGSSSYQTTQATVSFGPVKAMSGSTPARVGSMLSVGSPDDDDPSDVGLSRSSPTCCQQKPFRLLPAPGLKPVHGVPVAPCLTALETNICRMASASVAAPSFSSHTTHGTGSFPATAAPPATDGFSAVRRTLMLSDGSPPRRS